MPTPRWTPGPRADRYPYHPFTCAPRPAFAPVRPIPRPAFPYAMLGRIAFAVLTLAAVALR